MRLLFAFYTMQSTYRTYLHWIEWLLAVVAFGYLIYRLVLFDNYAMLSATLCQMPRTAYGCLLIAFVLIPVQLYVEVLRWRFTLRGWVNISIRQSWHQVLLGQVAGFITPYRAGDLPARLALAGLEISRDEWTERWHQWLKDWHKWFAVVGYTILRYLVWGIQLGAVLTAVGVTMPLGQGIASIVLYYAVISVMPALPAADVPLKGGWAVWIFGQYTCNVAAVLLAVSIIWLFNTILPVLFGSMKKILYFCTRKT